MTLTVLEHQKIYVGKVRNISKPQISFEDADMLRVVDIRNGGIFKWGNQYMIPQQWVGVISLPGLSLEILPKVVDSYDETFTKEILLKMFKVANNIPTKKSVVGKVDFAKNGLVEILITNYLNFVEHYLQEGFLASYQKVIRNISTVKGSIDFSRQINKNLLNPTRFVCRYSKLEIDNAINQLIKYVLGNMLNISNDYSNIKRIKVALVYFASVKNINDIIAKNLIIVFNRTNERIKIIVEYSYLFMDGYSISINNGKREVSSMLFDMNKIFENFIYHSYKKIYGNKVLYQNRRNYLISDQSKAIKRINLKPDLLIFSPLGVKMVVDTKWKSVKKFAKESDTYQMNAYVTAIDGVDTAILMYPMTKESSSAVGDYEFQNTSGHKELKIRAVDLSLIKDDTMFLKHLVLLLS
jgi:5-methylcytosine-specific restriction enzyme subunit McrC